jgi:hypothetical protein
VAALAKRDGGRTSTPVLSSLPEWRSGHRDSGSALLAVPGKWESL